MYQHIELEDSNNCRSSKRTRDNWEKRGDHKEVINKEFNQNVNEIWHKNAIGGYTWVFVGLRAGSVLIVRLELHFETVKSLQ